MCLKKLAQVPNSDWTFLYPPFPMSAGVGNEIRITKELRVSPSDLSELIISLGGVKFWIVAMVPLYIGWVLAQPAATRHLYIDEAGLVLALLVIGPFLSTFTLLLNTHYDMRTTDRLNPRKKYVQVVEELVDPGTLVWAAIGFAGLGLLLAWYVSANFVSYSTADTSGPLTSVIGTYGFVLIMGLVVLLGFGLHIASVGSLGLGWSQQWFPFSVRSAYDAMLQLWPFVGMQVVFYAGLLRRPTVGRIWALLLLLSIAEGIGVFLMLWGFVQGRALR